MEARGWVFFLFVIPLSYSFVNLDEEVLKDIFDIKARSYSNIDTLDPNYDEAEIAEIFQLEVNCDEKYEEHGVKCVNYLSCDAKGFIIDETSSKIEMRHAIIGELATEETVSSQSPDNWICASDLDVCCKDPKHIPCPSKDWNWNNNTCYISKELPYGALTWKQAEQSCRAIHENATLAEAITFEEQEYILSFNISQPFWIGATRKFRADFRDITSWTWQDGTSLTTAFWGDGQPNNGGWWVPVGERCIRMFNNRWDDHRCWDNNAEGLLCQLKNYA